jgi:hypothetical protein
LFSRKRSWRFLKIKKSYSRGSGKYLKSDFFNRNTNLLTEQFVKRCKPFLRLGSLNYTRYYFNDVQQRLNVPTYSKQRTLRFCALCAASYLLAAGYASGQASLSPTVVGAADVESSSSEQAELVLFEEIEVTQAQPNKPNRPTRESRATTSEPIFTLIGTSRIGNHLSAIVRHQDGENIRVSTGSGGVAAITGYEEYSIFDVGAGNLSVRYPSNVPCIVHKEKGVSCLSSPNTAQLQLVNAEALARVEPAPSIGLSADEATGVGPEGTANPFEALRAARAAGGNPAEFSPGGGRDGRNDQFTPRRIAPEDVPQGMRVVSTPFGDRLVEQ